MPNKDKTGPKGEGPKTGRQMGNCECAEPQTRGRGRGRPCRCRKVRGNPCSYFFKPLGIKIKDLEEVKLEMPEFEALRLIDFKEIPQEEAAKKMEISQPTLSRILKTARKKIADSIINGKAIKINN